MRALLKPPGAAQEGIGSTQGGVMPAGRGLLAILTLLGWVFSSQTANAAPITFNFTGTVTSTSGIWVGQGTAVTGFYTYDTALMDSGSTNDFDQFSAGVAGNELYSWEFSVSLGAVTRTTASNQNAAGTYHHGLVIFDRASEDRYLIQSAVVVASDDFAAISLRDTVGTPPDAIAVGTGNLTGVAPTTAPNLSLFDTIAAGTYEERDITGTRVGTVDFNVTSITLAVPEPTTALLFATGLAGLAMRRRGLP
ncbi:MAG: PEP-CTERM sorting domain-containing protein [bacterium]|nr:PEP-CTERM sorting domain-containing protein [bacterium]